MKFLEYLLEKRARAQERPEDTTSVSDGMLKRSMIGSVLGCLLCVVMLSATTWAWFSGNVSSGNNTIKTNRYELTVLVQDEDSAAVAGVETEGGTVYTLAANVTYTVTLEASGGGNGYCLIRVGASEPLYSDLIPALDDTRNPSTLTLRFTEQTTVTLLPCWGVYSRTPDLYNGDTVSG